jgi:hypothetical protein
MLGGLVRREKNTIVCEFSQFSDFADLLLPFFLLKAVDGVLEHCVVGETRVLGDTVVVLKERKLLSDCINGRGKSVILFLSVARWRETTRLWFQGRISCIRG